MTPQNPDYTVPATRTIGYGGVICPTFDPDVSRIYLSPQVINAIRHGSQSVILTARLNDESDKGSVCITAHARIKE
ncbi:MAG: hypothetical protein PHN98_01780 [Smithellaceae bacterium]|nr:hypothetical protein [Smithellaceae bacterium]